MVITAGKKSSRIGELVLVVSEIIQISTEMQF